MAKSKPKAAANAKKAKAPARAKTVARTAVKAPPRKPVAKAKPVAKPVKKSAKATPVKKPAPKPAAKPVAKKAVPAKKVSKPVPAKPMKAVAPKPVAKPAPAKPAAKAKPAPSTSSTAERDRKFVTTSKPETTVSKSRKAPAARPPLEAGVSMQDGRYVLPQTVTIDLPKGYRPSADEEYMSPRQLQFFRNKLSTWREELVEESRQTIESLRDEVRDVGDEAERATRETENSLELRTRDRYRKLIAKIDKALKRIEEGRYGFCEETDEEIGVDRLDARPIATLSLDAQERWEHRQKQMGD